MLRTPISLRYESCRACLPFSIVCPALMRAMDSGCFEQLKRKMQSLTVSLGSMLLCHFEDEDGTSEHASIRGTGDRGVEAVLV